MAQQANKHRSDREFSMGDFVFLKLQPYRQFSLRNQSFHKLNPKYFGPYRVIDRVGIQKPDIQVVAVQHRTHS